MAIAFGIVLPCVVLLILGSVVGLDLLERRKWAELRKQSRSVHEEYLKRERERYMANLPVLREQHELNEREARRQKINAALERCWESNHCESTVRIA